MMRRVQRYFRSARDPSRWPPGWRAFVRWWLRFGHLITGLYVFGVGLATLAVQRRPWFLTVSVPAVVGSGAAAVSYIYLRRRRRYYQGKL